MRIPAQGERRERELRKLVRRAGKPVALFVDEAHDLHSRTLSGLKRLMEVIGRGGGNLSVVLAPEAAQRPAPPDDGGDRSPHGRPDVRRAR